MESDVETFVKLVEGVGIHRAEKSCDTSIYVVFKDGHVGYLYVDDGRLKFDVNALTDEGMRQEGLDGREHFLFGE